MTWQEAFMVVAALFTIGFWLEGIGRKECLADELFTPKWLAGIGCLYVIFKGIL